MSTNAARRDIRTIFELYNVHIRKDALDYLTELTKTFDAERRKTYTTNIITRLRAELITTQSLDLDALKNLLITTSKRTATYVDVFNVVDMPTEFCHVFDTKTKKLELVARNSVDEFKQTNCLQRRMMHVMNFIDRKLPGQDNIKPIEWLFAQEECPATILAMVRRTGADSIQAEDLTGAVPMQFANTAMSGWLPFEGGCFLFDGLQKNGLFTVENVRLPVAMPPDLLPQLAVEDTFNRRNFAECSENDTIVFLSDVWLDSESVFDSLNKIFMHFTENPPQIFVLFGAFHSNNVGVNYLSSEIENFKRLAKLISDYSTTFLHTKFVLVPSSDDLPGTPILPRYTFLPAVQKAFATHRNVHFATNPCMILFKNRVISIIRDNIVDKISRSSLHTHSRGIDVMQCFVDTIWSQRHTSPVLPAISPTVPHLDDTLLIQFDPDLLVLADKFMPFVWAPDTGKPGSLTINPGSFAVNMGRVMVFWPHSKKVDFVPIVTNA